ncbi:MAG: Mov34/MPN/PAD-1 family protein [Candidatus Thermoplasmatota archaeon]|nr:Mov34/MPN/PAD-1 family protein [Candidatus Thermoplasmatota archaeon]MBS3817682.1 Mov34/MPN/PAD-1 family protein [Candidatus Thermoplasmatota archaeon]
MSLFGKKEITGITERVLKMVSESAKDAHPNEFAAGLREIDGVISELILVPGTVSGPVSAILKLTNLPVDYSIVGVVHTHPGRNPSPSKKDFNMFGRYGRIHIIMAYPYDLDSWQAYDSTGKEIDLEIIR